jgi:ABC-type sulfate transport system substrate-binding protein
VSGAARRTLLDAWAWARRTSQTDISPLVAATAARWAIINAPARAAIF